MFSKNFKVSLKHIANGHIVFEYNHLLPVYRNEQKNEKGVHFYMQKNEGSFIFTLYTTQPIRFKCIQHYIHYIC